MEEMVIKRERGFFGEGCTGDQITITKRVDKFEQKFDTEGEVIRDSDWPGGSSDAFFSKHDAVYFKKESSDDNKKQIEKSNKYEKWL